MTATDLREGLVLLDKPAGITSHDCVVAVRKLSPRKTKVGHGGTLDPFSTGLLILLVGKAARLARFLQGSDKSYEGVFRFGEGTDTFDRDGQATEAGAVPELAVSQWQEAANRFVGRSMQVPPDFSARRVSGKRAYELARKGLHVELEPREIEIYRFIVDPVSERDLHFKLKCSSGTYVRAVARDLGKAVGSPAHCLQLTRSDVGPFRLENANPISEPFGQKGFVPFDEIDLGMARHQVNHLEERLILFGHRVQAPPALQGADGFVKLVGPSSRFIAVAKPEARQLQPILVFPEGPGPG